MMRADVEFAAALTFMDFEKFEEGYVGSPLDALRAWGDTLLLAVAKFGEDFTDDSLQVVKGAYRFWRGASFQASVDAVFAAALEIPDLYHTAFMARFDAAYPEPNGPPKPVSFAPMTFNIERITKDELDAHVEQASWKIFYGLARYIRDSGKSDGEVFVKWEPHRLAYIQGVADGLAKATNDAAYRMWQRGIKPPMSGPDYELGKKMNGQLSMLIDDRVRAILRDWASKGCPPLIGW